MSQQSTPQRPAAALVEGAIAEHRTWFIVLGIVLILLGIVAIVFPLMSTIAVKIMVGWLFLIGGIVQIIHAFSTQKWSSFFLNLLVGILYVIAGDRDHHADDLPGGVLHRPGHS
jgi:uncharacterized membrane protein HdeD (DUF308 family)